MPNVIVPPGANGEEYALFGRILLQWGYIETRLSNILGWLTHDRFGLRGRKGVPQEFSEKVKVAKRGYCEIAAMGPLRNEAEAVLDALPRLHEKRIVIVHGAYQGTTKDGFVFVHFSDKKGVARISSHHFTPVELAVLLEDILRVDTALESLSQKTFNIPLPLV